MAIVGDSSELCAHITTAVNEPYPFELEFVIE
jgi:hypothetical protein